MTSCQVPDEVTATVLGPDPAPAVAATTPEDDVAAQAELVTASRFLDPETSVAVQRFVDSWLASCRAFVLRNPTPAFDPDTVRAASLRHHDAMNLGTTPESLNALMETNEAWEQVACYGAVFTEAQEQEHQAQVYLRHALATLDQRLVDEPRYRGGCVEPSTGRIHLGLSRRDAELEHAMLLLADLDQVRGRVVYTLDPELGGCTDASG